VVVRRGLEEAQSKSAGRRIPPIGIQGREIDPDLMGEVSRGSLWDSASRDLIFAAASVEKRRYD